MDKVLYLLSVFMSRENVLLGIYDRYRLPLCLTRWELTIKLRIIWSNYLLRSTVNPIFCTSLIGGCANDHFVEATLLFGLWEAKTHAQSVLTKMSYIADLKGGIGPTFGLYKTFSGNQRGLSYDLAKSDLEWKRDPDRLGGNAYFVSEANLLH